MIVGECAVPVQFHEVVADAADIIEGGGTLEMPCDLRALPGRQPGIDLGLQLVEAGAKLGEIFLRAGPAGRGGRQLVEFLLELGKRFFEVEIFAHPIPLT